MTDGPNTLRFTYDGAERLTKVEESQGFGLYRPLKSFTFATANGAGDDRLGKLQVARGYNYPVIGATSYTVEIDETYAYGGKEGRVSNRATVNVINGSAAESFTQSWVWNDLGDPASVTYPRCTQAGCSAGTVRTVSPTYTNGFLTAVPGYSSSITYHPNGQVNQVTHVNTPGNAATWVTDTYAKDPYNLPRPQKIEARRGATLLYQTGLYTFDGAGDVTKMGSSYYLYDKVNRVLSGVQYVGQGGGTAAGGYAFSHTYDGFGNLQAMTTKTGRSTPTSSTTNRLTGAVSYDAAGDLTSWNGNAYQYDALDQMWDFNPGSKDWLYLYTADGERIWSYDLAANTSHWTVRDLDGKVLRDYKNLGGSWSVDRDYVYRGDQLLAAVTPTGVQHFHLDHLGSVRFITNASGQGLAYHAYFPFGEEATNPTKDTERMKFAGHERDLANTSSAADDLDYMHARFCNPQLGRFLRVDPKGRHEALKAPQSWNRYSYTNGNPLKYVDPTGELLIPATGQFSEDDLDLLASIETSSNGREALDIIISSPVPVFFQVTDQPNNIMRQLILAQLEGQTVKAEGGTTIPTKIIFGKNGQQSYGGLDVKVYANVFKRFHPDPSGVTTTAHELGHAMRFLQGASIVDERARDRNGSAEAFGQSVHETVVPALQGFYRKQLELQLKEQFTDLALRIFMAI